MATKTWNHAYERNMKPQTKAKLTSDMFWIDKDYINNLYGVCIYIFIYYYLTLFLQAVICGTK